MQQRLQGHKNSPLTEAGKLQAAEVKEKLTGLKVVKAYVSPLQRALETLRIIIEGRSVEVVKVDGLKEIALGPWEGKTKVETKQSHPMEYEQFWNNQEQFYLEGAETFQHLQKRVVNTIEAIFTKHQTGNILVVSHWIAIKVALAHFTSTPLDQLSTISNPRNGEILTLCKKENRVVTEPTSKVIIL